MPVAVPNVQIPYGLTSIDANPTTFLDNDPHLSYCLPKILIVIPQDLVGRLRIVQRPIAHISTFSLTSTAHMHKFRCREDVPCLP